jgi:hypothetical protein
VSADGVRGRCGGSAAPAVRSTAAWFTWVMGPSSSRASTSRTPRQRCAGARRVFTSHVACRTYSCFALHGATCTHATGCGHVVHVTRWMRAISCNMLYVDVARRCRALCVAASLRCLKADLCCVLHVVCWMFYATRVERLRLPLFNYQMKRAAIRETRSDAHVARCMLYAVCHTCGAAIITSL